MTLHHQNIDQIECMMVNDFVEDFDTWINHNDFVRYHFYPQHLLTGDLQDYERVFTLDQIDQCYAWLRSEVGICRKPVHHNRTGTTQVLTDRSRRYLQDVYAADYVLIREAGRF